jgi:RNA polymerase sigma-70 factor, ECF subfamily
VFKRLSRQQRQQFKTQALVHLDALMHTAARLCGSAEKAEDAVQQTYLQAWKYWDTFEEGTNCKSWLFRILFNVIKKDYCAKKTEVIDSAVACNVLYFNPDRRIQAYEVMEAFELLKEEHRAILLLVAVEEMSYREAAFALKIPVGTVMSRLNRARVELRKLLENPEHRKNTRAKANYS